MELVTITNDPKALEGATFVFEAVAEANDVTGAVYSDINKYAADNVIIASCTSSIGADILADLTESRNNYSLPILSSRLICCLWSRSSYTIKPQRDGTTNSGYIK